MSDSNTKLERLKQQIAEAAELDAKRITEDAKKRADAMIKEETERIEKEQSGAMLSGLSKLENAERRRVSESKYAADRKVLLHRNALVDELFGEIRDELGKFAISDKYKAHIGKCAEAADKEEKLTSDVCVYCRKSDLETVGDVLKKYGVSVAADRNIKLGGLIFKYPAKGIFIDLTLDTAFEAERTAFASRSEMQL